MMAFGDDGARHDGEAFASWGHHRADGAAASPSAPSATPAVGGPGGQPPRSPELVRLRRIAAAAAAVALLAALALVVVLVRDGGGAAAGGDAHASLLVARAAKVTASEPGFEAALTITVTTAGARASIHATGSFDPADRNGSLRFDEGGLSLDELLVGPEVYLRLPAASAAALGAATPWVEADADAVSQAGGINSSLTAASDPAEELAFLRAAGHVTPGGTARVRGVETTRYRAVIDLAHYASVVPPSEHLTAEQNASQFERLTGQPTLPIDVWVDSLGRVRRMHFAVNVCEAAGNAGGAVTVDFYGYGPQPAVAPPPAGEVTDVTDRLAAGQAQAGDQAGGC